MPQLIGLILVVALIFGGLALTGGHAAMQALPFEMVLIGGAAFGTLLIGNSLATVRGALAGFRAAFMGAKWNGNDYRDLLVLLSGLMTRARRGGIVSIEDDIEDPSASAAFRAAPRISTDSATQALICDAFRLMALDLSDSERSKEHMARAIDSYVETRMRAVAALHTVADALPALGIVAAVLGIIRTMGAIDQSPAILGAMIGSALLGTFLGVFLAYGIVGPVAARFGQIVEEEAGFLETVRTVLGAYSDGLSPAVAVEMGRAVIPASLQPTPEALDHAVSAARFKPANINRAA